MKNDICFMPLGGGQNVGASCYFLQLGENNILLDAGTGIDKRGLKFNPNTYLLTSSLIQSMNQINNIFISHAHLDHIGCLTQLLGSMPEASVFMTDITKAFAELQLYDHNIVKKNASESSRLAVQYMLDKFITVSYMQKRNFGSFKTEFYPAGHIPGAMMVLFEYKKKRILYTGDYSLNATPLTSSCAIPKNVDILIMCCLCAKKANYKKRETLKNTLSQVCNYAYVHKRPVYCKMNQLSKGVEFLKHLCMHIEKYNMNINIYLDDVIMEVVRKMEKLSIPIMEPNIYHLSCLKEDTASVVLFNSRRIQYKNKKIIKVSFSLHDDFNETEKFIKLINPKKAVLVHCAQDENGGETIEQRLMYDAECRTQFIFAENGEIYGF